MALALPLIDVDEPETVAEDTNASLAPEVTPKGIDVENMIEVEPSDYNRDRQSSSTSSMFSIHLIKEPTKTQID